MNIVPILLCLLILLSCNKSEKLNESEVYTLYKSGVSDSSIKLHVATFNADDGSNSHDYNSTNCNKIRDFLQSEPKMFEQRFWCEPGYYKEGSRN